MISNGEDDIEDICKILIWSTPGNSQHSRPRCKSRIDCRQLLFTRRRPQRPHHPREPCPLHPHAPRDARAARAPPPSPSLPGTARARDAASRLRSHLRRSAQPRRARCGVYDLPRLLRLLTTACAAGPANRRCRRCRRCGSRVGLALNPR